MSWFISVNKAFANKNILQGFVVGTSVIPVPPEVKVEEWQIQGYQRKYLFQYKVLKGQEYTQ